MVNARKREKPALRLEQGQRVIARRVRINLSRRLCPVNSLLKYCSAVIEDRPGSVPEKEFPENSISAGRGPIPVHLLTRRILPSTPAALPIARGNNSPPDRIHGAVRRGKVYIRHQSNRI